MAKNLRWLNAIQFRREAHALMESFIKPPTTTGADAICSLVDEDENLHRIIWPSELNNYTFDSLAEFRIVKCLKFKTSDLARRAVAGAIKNKNKWRTATDIYEVLEALRNLPGYEQDISTLALSYKNYRGQYQKELVQFINVLLAQKSKGSEQIERTKVALTTLVDEWGSSILLDAVSHASFPESKAILLVIDHILKHQRDSSHFDFQVPDDIFVQDGLAVRWDQFSERGRVRLAPAFGALNRISSKALQTKIIQSIPKYEEDDESSPFTYTYFLAPLAQSDLDEDNLKRLQSWLDKNSSSGKSGFQPLVRYILYRQAQAGRWTMNDNLKYGYKSSWECKYNELRDSLSCQSHGFY